MCGAQQSSYQSLDHASWGWLASIRDDTFHGFQFNDGSSDVGLAVDQLQTRLAQVGNMLLMLDEAISDEKPMDLIRATIMGTLSLLTMTERPFELLVDECREAKLMRTKLAVYEQPENGPEATPEGEDEQ